MELDGVSALSIWWQIPLYTLGALSEVFCNVTAYEIGKNQKLGGKGKS